MERRDAGRNVSSSEQDMLIGIHASDDMEIVL